MWLKIKEEHVNVHENENEHVTWLSEWFNLVIVYLSDIYMLIFLLTKIDIFFYKMNGVLYLS